MLLQYSHPTPQLSEIMSLLANSMFYIWYIQTIKRIETARNKLFQGRYESTEWENYIVILPYDIYQFLTSRTIFWNRLESFSKPISAFVPAKEKVNSLSSYVKIFLIDC